MNLETPQHIDGVKNGAENLAILVQPKIPKLDFGAKKAPEKLRES